jgi:DNA repair protein RecO (recombination protein O)
MHAREIRASLARMEWRDEGILISVRRHGESAAIVEVFTGRHGRHAGVVRGGASRRMAPVLQPGAQLQVEWTARLEDHLGHFRVDPVRSRAAAVMGDRAALATLASVAALLTVTLPERAAHPELYAQTVRLLDALGVAPDWPARYALWELALLGELGFGLDLARCAASGATDDLVYVSPRTGRAVSRSAGAAWADRLLPLPEFLGYGGAADAAGLAAALRLTGHFLEARLAPTLPREALPPARGRGVAALLSAARDRP